jgi:hypothetical protein
LIIRTKDKQRAEVTLDRTEKDKSATLPDKRQIAVCSSKQSSAMLGKKRETFNLLKSNGFYMYHQV